MKRLAVVLLAVSQLLLALAGAQLWHFVLALLVFFTAFNLLEALLPSLVGRAAPAGTRGTAMGVYSTSQFLGVFVGGQMGGALYQWVGAEAVFYGCGALALIWLLVLVGMKELPKLDNRVLPLSPGQDWQALTERLKSVPGVVETVIVEVPNPHHPYGVRGIGETPIIPGLAAIGNAVSQALGQRMYELPMSPAKILNICKNISLAAE